MIRPDSSSWPVVQLSDCADILSGGTPFKGEPRFWGGSIPWVSAKDMKIFRLHDAEDHVTPEGADKGTRIAPAGSTLVLVRGMTLHDHVPICWLIRDMAFNQDVKAVVPKSHVDPEYLAYWLAASGARLHGLVDAAGHGTGRIGGPSLHALPVRLPPIEEQRSIARGLGVIDRKIEINHRMNRTLESLARAIFKSWFVDFDPVRKKMRDGECGLPPDLADHFPPSLMTSEGGVVPDGWAVERIGGHVDVARGLSYHGAGLSDAGVPMHNLNSVLEGGGYKFAGIKFYRGDFQPRHAVREGEVLVANTEQGHERRLIGFPAVVPGVFGEAGIFTHHLYRLRPCVCSPLSAGYLYHLLASSRMHRQVSGFATGTTVNILPADALALPWIVVPPADLIRTFDRFATRVRVRCERLHQETGTLQTIRDSLLPQLMNGGSTLFPAHPVAERRSQCHEA